MYHMLAGRPPFKGTTIPQIIAQKMSGDVTSLSAGPNVVSEQTSQLVDDMLKLKASDRLHDYSHLINRIDTILQQRLSLQVNSDSNIDTLTTILERPQPQSIPTTEVNQSLTPHQGRPYFKIAMFVIAALLLVGFLLFLNPNQIKTPARNMVSSGWSEPFFNGQTLGVMPASGSLTVDKDDEGADVISGINGMILRPLIRSDLNPPRPLENYKLLFFIQLHKATAVELHFGIGADQNRNGPRSVLRVTPEQVIITARSYDRGPLSEPSHSLNVGDISNQYHVVELEYQHGHWWVSFDEQLVGSVNSQKKTILPEIRISVEGGPAWLSDLQIEELVPVSTSE